MIIMSKGRREQKNTKKLVYWSVPLQWIIQKIQRITLKYLIKKKKKGAWKQLTCLALKIFWLLCSRDLQVLRDIKDIKDQKVSLDTCIQKGQKVSEEIQGPGETKEEKVQVDLWEDLALKDQKVPKVKRWVCTVYN